MNNKIFFTIAIITYLSNGCAPAKLAGSQGQAQSRQTLLPPTTVNVGDPETIDKGKIETDDGEVITKPAKLIFAMQLPKTPTRSRELFSQLCTQEAKKFGYSENYKAVISLTASKPVHASDQNQKMDARDYILIEGPIKNVSGEIIADNAAEFWSPIHKAMISDLQKNVPQAAISTGSTAQGVYPQACATDDANGKSRGCNCDNLQTADGGHGKRFASGFGGNMINGTDAGNWAFSLTRKEGQTICTFDHHKYAPTNIYCIAE
jgi:hypothetical protein